MLEIVTVTFKAFGKVRFKDIVVSNQNYIFGDFDVLRNLCTEDQVCEDFVLLKLVFRKVEVFQ